MNDFRFKPEDFEFKFTKRTEQLVLKCFPEMANIKTLSSIIFSQVAEQANAKLQKWLDSAHTVYGHHGDREWCDLGDMKSALPKRFYDHKAKLVCIEEVK